MENEDKYIGLIEKSNINNTKIFKPDYDEQNLDNNRNFQNWKSEIIKNYGNEGIFYKCPNDKIYFYEEGINKIEGICPLCHKEICFFCMKNVSNHICCLKRKFTLMCQAGKINMNKDINDFNDYEQAFIFYFLIPGVNIIFFIGIFLYITFYQLDIHYDKSNNHPDPSTLRCRKIEFCVIVATNGIMSIFLAISFFIYGILFSLIFLIFIIFKKRFCAFLSGFFYKDWEYIYKNFHDLSRRINKILCRRY